MIRLKGVRHAISAIIHISDLEIDNNSTYFHQMHMMVLNISDAQPVVGQKNETHFKGIDTQPIKGN